MVAIGVLILVPLYAQSLTPAPDYLAQGLKALEGFAGEAVAGEAFVEVGHHLLVDFAHADSLAPPAVGGNPVEG